MLNYDFLGMDRINTLLANAISFSHKKHFALDMPEIYYIYAYYSSLNMHWPSERTECLKILGINLKTVRNNESDEFISGSFAKDKLYLMLIDGFYLFYLKDIYMEKHFAYPILFTEHPEMDDLLILYDGGHIDKTHKVEKFQIKKDYIKAAWNDSVCSLSNKAGINIGKIFEIQSNEVSICGIDKIIIDFVSNEYIHKINRNNEILKRLSSCDAETVISILTQYVESFKMLIDIFMKSINLSSLIIFDDNTTIQFEKILEREKKILNDIALFYIHNKKDKIKQIIDELAISEHELFEFLKKKIDNVSQYVNYALSCNVITNSEKRNPALNLVDSNNSIYNCHWEAERTKEKIWMVFDLKDKFKIDYIIIRQYPVDPKYFISDFLLLASYSGEEWITLYETTNNKDGINRINLKNAKYRYFKIIINKNNAFDNIARLSGFEVWGKCTVEAV